MQSGRKNSSVRRKRSADDALESEIEGLKDRAALSSDHRVIAKLIAARDSKVRAAVVKKIGAGARLESVRARWSVGTVGLVEVCFDFFRSGKSAPSSVPFISVLVDPSSQRLMPPGESGQPAPVADGKLPLALATPNERITTPRDKREDYQRRIDDFLNERVKWRDRFTLVDRSRVGVIIHTEQTDTSVQTPDATITESGSPPDLDDSQTDYSDDGEQSDDPADLVTSLLDDSWV